MPLQRTPAFTNCRTIPVGTEDPEETALTSAAAKAKSLASGALGALEQPIGAYGTALQAHFGGLTGAQKETVKARYHAIGESIESKNFECKTACPNPKEKRENCAEGETPGNKIYICPSFGPAKNVGSRP